MSYLGNTPTTALYAAKTDSYNGDGSTLIFTLSRSVTNTEDLEVIVNNVQQDPFTAYTVSGTTLTFTEAPSSGTGNILVTYRNNVITRVIPDDDTISASMLQANSVTTTKIADNSITTAKIAPGTVIAADILDGSVDNNKLASANITGNKLVNSTITGNLLADNVIRANNIVAGQITGNLFASGVVANATTATTFTALQTFTGTISNPAIKLFDAVEAVNVTSTAASSNINYDITTQSIMYANVNATGNWTVNFRGSSSTTLDTLMANNESMTCVLMALQGSPAYFANTHQIDGTGITPKWQGNTAPTAGNANSIDIYSYTIIKRGSATFDLFASQTQFSR